MRDGTWVSNAELGAWVERNTHRGYLVNVTLTERRLALMQADAVRLIERWAAQQPPAVIDMSMEIGDELHEKLREVEERLLRVFTDDDIRHLALLPEVWEQCDVAGMGTTLRGLARRGVGWVVMQPAYDWLRAHQPQAAS
jgi:hypothetical protein